PATPVPPSMLEAMGVAGNAVSLTWSDNSTNETGFLVYRSTDGTGFQSIATLNPNTNAFTDESAVPQTRYYYYVAGVNGAGQGEKSNTVQIKAGNQAPAITGLSNITVQTGQTGTKDFIVSDEPGDVVIVEIKNKPAFVSVSQTGGNNYRLTAMPTLDN